MSWPSRKPKDSSRWRCPGRADRAPGSVRGRRRTQSGSRPSARDLLLEWAWDVNAHLDPTRIAAGSRERVAWRCLLDSAHVWETKVADRTYRASFWPYPMGNRVHPAESLAAYFPWLALEWHPSRNDLRPDQVTRASAREVVWRCERGPEWSTAVIVMVAVFLGLQVFGTPIASTAAVIVGVGFAYALFRLPFESLVWAKGIEGERKTAAFLEPLL